MAKVKKSNLSVKDKYDKPFPKLLRELRKKYKISQIKLAKALNTNRQTISSYELGNTVPDIYSAQKIVDYFNTNCKLNYSIEYWLGKEEIYKNTEKEIIKFSNNSIENLREYQNNSRVFLALELIINQKDFLKQVSDYVVNSNLYKIIDENDLYSDFITYWCHINNEPNDIEEKSFYKIIRELGILHNYSKTQIIEELKNNKEPLMECIEEIMLNYADFGTSSEYIEIMTGKTSDEIFEEESKYFEKKEKEIENTKEGKELIKAYKNYKNKRIDYYNERKRSRKK